MEHSMMTILVLTALIFLNAAVYISAMFSDIAFSIDAEKRFHRGPLGFTRLFKFF